MMLEESRQRYFEDSGSRIHICKHVWVRLSGRYMYVMCQRVYRISDVDQSFVTCLVLLPPCLPKILPATMYI